MWGKLAVIDLRGCNERIKEKAEIKRFIQKLCIIIGMKRVGPTKVKRFGKGKLEGYSAFQFIETSSITCHLDETKNRAFIDIFSCKDFDTKKAVDFSKRFFQAQETQSRSIIRQ